MKQAVAHALGDLDALGSEAAKFDRRAAPGQQAGHDEHNERIDPPQARPRLVGLLDRQGTVGQQLVLFCHMSDPPQLSFLRRYWLVFSMMNTTTNSARSTMPKPS